MALFQSLKIYYKFVSREQQYTQQLAEEKVTTNHQVQWISWCQALITMMIPQGYPLAQIVTTAYHREVMGQHNYLRFYDRQRQQQPKKLINVIK